MDIKIKIKTSFVIPKGPKDPASKTGINFFIFILIFVENCNMILWLRTGYNPVDINRFQSHTGNYLIPIFRREKDSYLNFFHFLDKMDSLVFIEHSFKMGRSLVKSI